MSPFVVVYSFSDSYRTLNGAIGWSPSSAMSTLLPCSGGADSAAVGTCASPFVVIIGLIVPLLTFLISSRKS